MIWSSYVLVRTRRTQASQLWPLTRPLERYSAYHQPRPENWSFLSLKRPHVKNCHWSNKFDWHESRIKGKIGASDSSRSIRFNGWPAPRPSRARQGYLWSIAAPISRESFLMPIWTLRCYERSTEFMGSRRRNIAGSSKFQRQRWKRPARSWQG